MELPVEEKFELKQIPISVRGQNLAVHTVGNWDAFVEKLEEKGASYIKDLPFWVKIWEASIVLADHLMNLDIPKNASILEIGAGMGITGLFLGTLGYEVTITDYAEDALALLRKNVAHNQLKTVTVEKLDWNKPELERQFDIICGSELIYKESFILPIIQLFRKYLKPQGRIYLAHDYSRKCLMQLIGMIPGRFEVENKIKTMRSQDEAYRIVVHTLAVK